jgi:hypothetical protein
MLDNELTADGNIKERLTINGRNPTVANKMFAQWWRVT